MKDYNRFKSGLHFRDLIKGITAAGLGLAAVGLGLSSANAQEGVPHELPIVTHWSNQKGAFEYMASDKPQYRVPPPEEKYQPGNSYYYYREGKNNFLPDLNNYVGMNFSIKAVGEKQAGAVAERVVKATGVDLKFYRPDAFTKRNAPTRLKEAPGYVQVVHGKIIKASEEDPGCLAAFSEHRGRGYHGRTLREKRYRYTEWTPLKDKEGETLRELYDLEEDPFEYDNLAADPGHESLVAELSQRLKAGGQGAQP